MYLIRDFSISLSSTVAANGQTNAHSEQLDTLTNLQEEALYISRTDIKNLTVIGQGTHTHTHTHTHTLSLSNSDTTQSVYICYKIFKYSPKQWRSLPISCQIQEIFEISYRREIDSFPRSLRFPLPLLRTGQFGEVYRGVLERGAEAMPVAVKMTKETISEFLKEMSIMSQMMHPNIVRLYGIVTQSEPHVHTHTHTSLLSLLWVCNTPFWSLCRCTVAMDSAGIHGTWRPEAFPHSKPLTEYIFSFFRYFA